MPSPRRGTAGGPCPIGRTADILGDRWSLLIMREVTGGTTRFDEFKAELHIADNVLSDRLRRLVGAQLLVRVPYRLQEGGRTRHEYRLTKAGEDFFPVLHAMMEWGNAHSMPAVAVEPMRLVHSVCGEALRPGSHCVRCGRDVQRPEAAWMRPWRDESPKPLGVAASS